MPKLRVHNFSISLDGYGAGPDQSPENPLGVGGEQLHDWEDTAVQPARTRLLSAARATLWSKIVSSCAKCRAMIA